MIDVNVKIGSKLSNLGHTLSAIDANKLATLQASTLMAVMRTRIHVDGLASDGQPIGVYSPSYLKRRAKAGRGTDPKVILSFTRTMENSWSLIPLEKGSVGIGFQNPAQAKKAGWLEEMYERDIFKPTSEEKKLLDNIREGFIKEIIDKA